MIELPEAITLAKQMEGALVGRRVASAVANASPHGFAWYFGEPAAYADLLKNQKIEGARAFGGHVEMLLDGVRVAINDGTNVRLLPPDAKRPQKHQLLIEFEDGSALVYTVRMYGGILAFPTGAYDNPYYRVAQEKPSPLSDAFDEAYFDSLRKVSGVGKLSAKAFLATEQRIPGLGNGVLQDILFNAGVHPKRAIATLSDSVYEKLFHCVKDTLSEITEAGGRDVERDLFGNAGGYTTKCSRMTLGMPCPACGEHITKEVYMGGAVYYCPGCQRRA